MKTTHIWVTWSILLCTGFSVCFSETSAKPNLTDEEVLEEDTDETPDNGKDGKPQNLTGKDEEEEAANQNKIIRENITPDFTVETVAEDKITPSSFTTETFDQKSETNPPPLVEPVESTSKDLKNISKDSEIQTPVSQPIESSSSLEAPNSSWDTKAEQLISQDSLQSSKDQNTTEVTEQQKEEGWWDKTKKAASDALDYLKSAVGIQSDEEKMMTLKDKILSAPTSKFGDASEHPLQNVDPFFVSSKETSFESPTSLSQFGDSKDSLIRQFDDLYATASPEVQNRVRQAFENDLAKIHPPFEGGIVDKEAMIKAYDSYNGKGATIFCSEGVDNLTLALTKTSLFDYVGKGDGCMKLCMTPRKKLWKIKAIVSF